MAIKLFKSIKSIIPGILFCAMIFPAVWCRSHGQFIQEQRGVTLKVKALSLLEARSYFKSLNIVNNVLMSKNYKVLELLIENKSDDDLLLSQEGISLPMENLLTIKHNLKTHLWWLPFFAAGLTMAGLVGGIGFAVVPSVVASFTVGISVATIDTSSANRVVEVNVRNKSINPHHPTVIPACEMVQKMIFVKKRKFKKTFVCSLQTIDKNKNISFDVCL